MNEPLVAVIIDEQGRISPFPGNAPAKIYHRWGDVWVCRESVAFSVEKEWNSAIIRDRLQLFIAALGQTRILAASSISGIAYSLLNRHGFKLCEMGGFSPDCLDALVESVKTATESVPTLPHPIEISPSIYQCDLTVVLQEYPDLSSKKVLRPFFDKTPFVELRLSCGHMPPWLTSELKMRGLVHSKPVATDGKLLVSIKAVCLTECRDDIK